MRHKLTKKVLSLLVTMAMLLSMIPMAYAGESQSEEGNPSQNDEVDPRDMGYRGAGGDYVTLPKGPDMDSKVINVNAANAQYVLDGAYGSIDGKTINFTESMTEELVIGRPTKYTGSNTKYYRTDFGTEERTFEFIRENDGKVVDGNYSHYYTRAISGVTFTSDTGVTLRGFAVSGGAHVYGPSATDYVRDVTMPESGGSCYYFADNLSNITFRGLTLTSKTNIETSLDEASISNFTFENCTFNINNTAPDNQAIRYYNENNNGKVRNLTVTGCTFKNCFQGVYTQHVNGITVTGSSFDTTGHNAIAVQSGDHGAVNHGAVVITGNTFSVIGDRVIRFGNVGADTQITIKNNKVTDDGNANKESMKAESLVAGVTYDITGNNWSGFKNAYNSELIDAAAVAKIGDVYYATLAAAIDAAKSGDTVKLLKDVTVGNSENKTNFWINKSIILDLNTNTLTGAYQLAVGVNDVEADVTVKNGTLVGSPYYCAYLVNGKLTLDGITIDYSVARPVQLAETGTGKTLIVKNSAIRSTGEKQFGIMSFDINNKIVIENSAVSADYWAVYHNGSYHAFELTAENSTLTSKSAQGIYISGSTITAAAAGKNQKATFTNCTITGATGIEGKYTDITLDNCTVTATLEEPEFVQNNNGSTANGFSVVSTDNSMSPSSPAPTAVVTINGGRYTGPVGLIQFIDHGTYPDFKEATYIVTGGTFSNDPSTYVARGYAAVKTGESEWKVGKTYSATFNVTPSDATVEVKCGDVTVNGDLTAPKNYSGLNTVNTYTYTVSRSGYVTKTGTITPPVDAQAADITVALDPVYYGGGSSSSSSSSSGSTTTTEKNPDGSTTTTVTDKKTGTVTETTKEKDGTTTTVETKKDGTVTETVKTAEGVTGTVVTDKNGDVTEVKSTVSSTAAKEAAKTGEAVTLPVEVPAVTSTENAPAVQVTVPKSAGSVKVEVPVEKVTPGTVAVIVKADGTEEIVSTSLVTENGVALTLDGSATVKVIDNSKDFIDVPESNVFYNEVSSLSAREIMVGKTDDTFDLHNSVTLNQIANVAGRITGAVDVKDFNAGIVWGQENGLKTGNVAATRGEVLKALYVAAGSPAVDDLSVLNRFNDAGSIPADMAAAAAWAAQNGILKGGLDGNASLNANVTRGQTCALAGRTMTSLA